MGLFNRFALGTAQFGLPYGVANEYGQIEHAEAKNILTYVRSKGLDTIDTAVAYGDSEQQLGDIGVESWKVISKVAHSADSNNPFDYTYYIFEKTG